jgi:iron complex outermembrane receptor protein
MARFLVLPAVILGLAWAAPLNAQQRTGTITGQVVDSTTQAPVSGAVIAIPGTALRTLSRADGTFLLRSVPEGARRVRATRIGYGPQQQDVTVSAGAEVPVRFSLSEVAAVLEEVVVTGYGEQRREAITGSVATIDAPAADVGVVVNVNNLIQGRAAGVEITRNNGEPGAGASILIRGGTSISASNEPLYVIDGVPLNNVQTEAQGVGIGGTPPLARSPLNLLNPSDIASITVLKDASATAIYGSRAANGVILIETKKGAAGGGGSTVEYDSYVAAASPSRYLNVLNGDQYRQFVRSQVAAGNLDSTHLAALGTANTNWERAVTRTSVTHNHDIAFTGGSEDTRYRASLNYMNQQGVVQQNGLERFQARLNVTHNLYSNRLRLGLNVATSHIFNHYLPYENTGGFEGGVFQNVAVFNPTQPIAVTDSTGQHYYEIGPGRQSVRNPVAVANQVSDFGHTTRTLGNVTAELDLVPGLTAQVNVGGDRSSGLRQTYLPGSSPVGAEWNGLARQVERTNSALTLQTLLTYRRQGDVHSVDVVGGYEFSKYNTSEFGAEGHGYLTDAFTFNNLGGASVLVRPYSWTEERRFVSFFARANYSFRNRYFLTGVLRDDGASQFGAGNKRALFPAISGSWHLSDEAFLRGTPLPDLRLRVGYGLQGNPAVPPYASLLKLEPDGGARYVFAENVQTGVVPVQNANPNLKWEQTSQVNVAVDFTSRNNRLSGTVEYYVKNTKDLLLTVPVAQPAPVSTMLQNVGKLRNRGLEISLDALLVSQRDRTWRAGLVFSRERNTVLDLGPFAFITTGNVSGQGQSGQVSERIMPGSPLGTFFGPQFIGVCGAGDPTCTQGQQLFNKYQVTRDANGRVTSRTLVGKTTSPGADDYLVIGNANPSFTFGLTSQATWGKFDASFLIRGSIGQDVFNNTALVYATKSDALQNKNFLVSALSDPTGIREPAIYSSRWIEKGSFARLQNLTVGYTFSLADLLGPGRTARLYVSGDNLILLTKYSGYDPEVHSEAGLASRGIDYLSYPRPRTFTAGIHVAF